MPRCLKNITALLGSAALLLSLAPVSHAAGSSIRLGAQADGLSGAKALSALGENLAAAAVQSGKTPKELRSLLLRDSTLKLTRDGHLYYEERAPRLSSGAAPADSLITGDLYPLADSFKLHSRPGAPRLLILNFQGKTVTGTAWNTSLKNPSIVATPYDADSNPASYSDAELTTIQTIWQRVSEDYAPYDVDVTTDVSAAATAQASTYATAVITKQRIFSSSAPGLAYVSTFGNPAYEPAFVAFDTLYNNPKYIAEAVSHELGHRLGLDHDGTRTQAYYAGQGTAPMTWAPIMGNSYAANISQFSKGEYSAANNKQDDFMVMNRYLPFRTDSAGDTAAKAVALSATSSNGRTSGTADGAIERLGDVDLFSLVAGSGPMTVTVNPVALSANLDLSVSLLSDAGRALATSNAERALNAAFTFSVPKQGTYYLKVAGAGYGNAASNGYSNYGSRGLYRVTASYAAPASAPPKAQITASAQLGLAPLAVNLSAASIAPADALYSWDLANGSTPTGASVSATYTAPGIYPVVLKVSSPNGLSSQVAQNITVAKEVSAQVSITRVVNPDRTVRAEAVIPNSILDGAGNRLLDPVVYGSWSGAVSGDAARGGMVKSGIKLASPTTSRLSDCITFTLTRVEAYDPTVSAPVNDATSSSRQVYLPKRSISATACPQQAAR